MQRFISNRFLAEYKATIGADFASKDLIIDDKAVSLQVLDDNKIGMGHSRTRTLSKSGSSFLQRS